MRAAVALGDARVAVRDLEALVATARTPGHAPTLAEALLVDAEALEATDAFDAAIAAAREALAAAERGHDDDAAARAYVLRVALAAARRDLAAAEDIAP